MNFIIINFYIDKIKSKIELLEQEDFNGNIEFKINFKNGSIANMNVSENRSVKMPELV